MQLVAAEVGVKIATLARMVVLGAVGTVVAAAALECQVRATMAALGILTAVAMVVVAAVLLRWEVMRNLMAMGATAGMVRRARYQAL